VAQSHDVRHLRDPDCPTLGRVVSLWDTQCGAAPYPRGVSARRVNPEIRIASRADTDEEGVRLRRVGADAVVSVSVAGGRRLADAMASPDLAQLADAMVRHGAPELLLREAGVVEHSRADGRRLDELRVTEVSGAVVLAVRPRPGKPYVLRPLPSTRVDARATLLVLGDRDALHRLDELVIP